jgi:hypothetical protein
MVQATLKYLAIRLESALETSDQHGVLGFFPPKTTLIATDVAGRGFPGGITFS